MGLLKQITAPVRSILRFPLFQLAIVVAIILFLQAADPVSVFGRIFTGLDKLVGGTVDVFAAVFNVRSFTKSWLTSGFWIGYVYLACLLILSAGAAGVRANRRSRRAAQCVLAAQRDCARARHRRLPRLGAVRENPAAAHSAAAMGRNLRLAARRQAALSAAGAAAGDRGGHQCGGGFSHRAGAAIFDAVPGHHLVRPAGQNAVRLRRRARYFFAGCSAKAASTSFFLMRSAGLPVSFKFCSSVPSPIMPGCGTSVSSRYRGAV